MPDVLLFDLNETLLDLGALDPLFARMFGDAAVRKTWFAQVLQLFMTATIIDHYRSFDLLVEDALTMVASIRAYSLTAADRDAIRTALGHLPPHPDVLPGLTAMRDAGFRLVALTNSTANAATTLIDRAGLRPLFEHVLSADAVKRYKPARAVYEYAAQTVGVPIAHTRLVAAHGWDIAGAMQAGCKAAFVARPGATLSPAAARPDLIVADLRELATRLSG